MVAMQQVHGSVVVRVDRRDDGKTVGNCDSLTSNDPNVTLCVRVADCLPISVIDAKTHAFGIVHAGWRGLDKKIITKTVQSMIKEFHSDPEDLKIKIGPHICQKHYEVKDDVFSKFAKLPDAIFEEDNKAYLDLAKVAECQLIESGVKKENIKIDKTCTFENKNLFSYRRNHTLQRNLYSLHLVGG